MISGMITCSTCGFTPDPRYRSHIPKSSSALGTRKGAGPFAWPDKALSSFSFLPWRKSFETGTEETSRIANNLTSVKHKYARASCRRALYPAGTCVFADEMICTTSLGVVSSRLACSLLLPAGSRMGQWTQECCLRTKIKGANSIVNQRKKIINCF